MPKRKDRVSKKKTFTGCWSCRELKVKCDCTRPQCKRCSRSGKTCKGYDISLTWIDAQSAPQRPTAIKRQAMGIAPTIHTPVMSIREMDAALASIDVCVPTSENDPMFAGPFGIFCMAPPDGLHDDQTARALEVHENFQPQESLTQDRIASVAHPVIRKNPLVNFLLCHYSGHVATMLQPISQSKNAYHSIHAPVATEAWDALCNTASDTTSSVAASGIAVLFSLLAISAMHLHSVSGVPFGSLVHDFRDQAYSNLSLALSTSILGNPSLVFLADELAMQNLENIMSASLTLVTLDVMQGEMREFGTHLAATMRMSDILPSEIKRRPRVRSMIDIAGFLHIISESTNWDLDMIPWESDSIATKSVFLKSGVLEGMARVKNFYTAHGSDPPMDFRLASTELANTVDKLPICEPNTDLLQDSDEHTCHILREHIEAFALGVKVYYHACMCPCSKDEMGVLVQQVLEKLESIERRRELAGSHYEKTATIAWPGFIASCESHQGDRERWIRWWSHMRTYGIGNIQTLWEIVEECWRFRDRCSDYTAAWITILRAKGQFILAI